MIEPTKFFAIAVTGGRHQGMIPDGDGGWKYHQPAVDVLLADLEALWTLAGGTKRDPVPVMLNGACPRGLDALAKWWAEERGYYVRLFIPNWDRDGKAAGPLRNHAMIDEADALVALPGGRGTADCVRRAERKGIPIYRALP